MSTEVYRHMQQTKITNAFILPYSRLLCTVDVNVGLWSVCL